MKNKKGFTVAELMIAIGLMGVLIALAIPATVENLPNKNLMKFHRTLNSFQTAIQAVLMDASETQEFSDSIRTPIKRGDPDDNPCFKQRTCVEHIDPTDPNSVCKKYSNLENETEDGAQCFDNKGNARYRAESINAAYTAGMQYPLVFKGTPTGSDQISVEMLCNYIAGKMNVKENKCGEKEFTTSDNVRYKFDDNWAGGDNTPTSIGVTIRVEPGEDSVSPEGDECTTRIQHATNTFTLQLTPQGKIIMNCPAATRMIIE